jgi:hypothetical protein
MGGEMTDRDVAERLADELGGCLIRTDQHGDVAWIEWDAELAAATLREAQALALESAADWFSAFARRGRDTSDDLMHRSALVNEREYAARVLRCRAAELRERVSNE